jgi:large subunit ribosomal protein L17
VILPPHHWEEAMRHLVDHRKLNRTSSHRLAMLRNMVCSLFVNGRIMTTVPKAKEARRLAEKCITFAKDAALTEDKAKNLHLRRLATMELHDRAAVKILFEKVGPNYKDRLGGYTRILKAGYRHGDKSPIALFELV